MALNAYLKITGQKSGQIAGGVTQKGREGSIYVDDLAYGVVSPRDPASGLPTGRRQHQPVQVTVPTGRQTPLVFNAAVTNENLTMVEVDFWLPGAGGRGLETLAFTLKLTNASISEFDLNLETDTSGSSSLLDKYSFTFQKIELTWTDGGITAEDDWSPSPA